MFNLLNAVSMKKLSLSSLRLTESNTLSNEEKKNVIGGGLSEPVSCSEDGGYCGKGYACQCGVCVDLNFDTDCWCC